MKASQLKSKKYVASADLDERGQIVTIEDVSVQTIRSITDGTSKEKGVLSFAGNLVKPLALNSTNVDILIELLGDDTDDWPGKKIMLYADPDVVFGDKKVGGIRIKKSSGAKKSWR